MVGPVFLYFTIVKKKSSVLCVFGNRFLLHEEVCLLSALALLVRRCE